jgi:hypothetical protein
MSDMFTPVAGNGHKKRVVRRRCCCAVACSASDAVYGANSATSMILTSVDFITAQDTRRHSQKSNGADSDRCAA